jgi:hypothetical protein
MNMPQRFARTRGITYNPERKVYERKILEEDVVKEIMQRLGYAQIKVFRHRERIPIVNGKFKRFAGGSSTPGIPDLFGWIKRSMTYGIPFYIEVKRPGDNRHRPAQTKFIEEAKADGVIAFFAESYLDVQKGFMEAGIELK